MVATFTGSNVRFETTAPASLPGGVGVPQVTVPTGLVEPGPQGTCAPSPSAGSRVRWPCLRNATNPDGTYGGTVKQAPTVKQGDKDRSPAQLLEQATQKAYAPLEVKLLDEGEFVPPEKIATLVERRNRSSLHRRGGRRGDVASGHPAPPWRLVERMPTIWALRALGGSPAEGPYAGRLVNDTAAQPS